MEFPEVSNGSGGMSGKNFLKMKDGESVRGVFRGVPVIFRQHWSNGRGIVCPGKACDLCAEKNKALFRFRLNFVMQEGGQYVSRIVEQGWQFFNALKELNEEYPLENHVVKISRSGTGSDTKYQVIPTPNGLLANGTKKAVEAVQLHELSPFAEAKEEEAVALADEDLPF